jgi:rare lipoprotein A
MMAVGGGEMTELPTRGRGQRKLARGLSTLGAILIAAILSNCAETEQTKQSPQPGAGYKIGKPYKIKGVWYHPEVDYQYTETGIASWYGPNFHGKPTANGEIFDMNKVSAAHRTLPLPSVVRVTNLDNGRSLKMRVNDRGPFARERIIDVSRRSAQLLGFYREGTARVRVEVVADESRQLAVDPKAAPRLTVADPGSSDSARNAAEVAGSPPRQPPSTSPEPATASVVVREAPVLLGGSDQAMATPEGSIVPIRAASPSQLYIQAGAYSRFDNADRVRAQLSGLGPVDIHPFQVGGRSLYRVRLGPISSSDEADRLLAETVRAGYPGSHIVFE